MKAKIREYLTFTRKERLGVVVLLIIILILFILPYWIRRPPGTEDPAATRQLAALLEKMNRDSIGRLAYAEKRTGYNAGSAATRPEARNPEPVLHGKLFYFDPNTISESDWQRLGLTERQSRTLVHYTGKGGHFRKAADLEKIYGLSAGDRQRLMPYVRITAPTGLSAQSGIGPARFRPGAREERAGRADPGKASVPENQSNKTTGGSPGYERTYPKKTPAALDINRADSTEWEQLPGIGGKLAARIIHFRDKLGGFYSVDQVGETFGLPDSSFQKIRPWLKPDSTAVRRIDLNTVSAEALRQHPYIRWKLANVLLRYREQHGKFASVDELGQLALVDAVSFSRLRPYLAVLKQ